MEHVSWSKMQSRLYERDWIKGRIKKAFDDKTELEGLNDFERNFIVSMNYQFRVKQDFELSVKQWALMGTLARRLHERGTNEKDRNDDGNSGKESS